MWIGDLDAGYRADADFEAVSVPYGDGAFAFAGIAAPALDRLVQRAVIEVEERGTTASAVTGGLAVPTSIAVPFDLRIDRPFAFSIRHVATGAVLFAAWIDNPQAG